MSLNTQPQQKIALIGGTLIDGLGSTPVYKSLILVDVNTISATGTQSEIEISEDYQRVPTEDITVMTVFTTPTHTSKSFVRA